MKLGQAISVMNKLTVGKTVMIKDQIYVVDHSETFGGQLKLIPIKYDPAVAIVTVTAEVINSGEVMDYVTRRPIF